MSHPAGRYGEVVRSDVTGPGRVMARPCGLDSRHGIAGPDVTRPTRVTARFAGTRLG
ncbi:hypothetical protein ACFWU5_24925 [Nocardia sp. NPDC058640]|uniref:hypothetical protein n=1 Tax=Nocardia sp. NPDC058640 TaxID=3346571 RepID=UPI003652F11E